MSCSKPEEGTKKVRVPKKLGVLIGGSLYLIGKYWGCYSTPSTPSCANPWAIKYKLLFHFVQNMLLKTAAASPASSHGSLKHFNGYNNEELEGLCPWLDRKYCCNHYNRPPYRLQGRKKIDIPLACFPFEVPFFERVWYEIKVLIHPNSSSSKQ